LLTIVLVDDNPDDLYMIKRSLVRGFDQIQIREVMTSQALEETLLTGDFDLVITDYHLGFSDGLKVLKRIKQRHPACPVVMFTLTGSEEIAVEAMKSGFEDYILKTPQHLAQLTATVTRILNHQLERKALESTRKALQESETRYRSMFQSDHAMMLVYDPNSSLIVDANPAACTTYGYSLTEFTNLTLQAINLGAQESLDLNTERVLNGEINFFEVQHRLKNRQIVDMEIYSAPLEVNGRTLIYQIIHDVTERRAVQEQLKLQAVVLEAAANAIVILNRQGTIQWANLAFTNLTGYDLSEVVGQNLRLLDSMNQPTSFYNAMWNQILEGRIWQGQLKNRRKDGSEYVEEMTMTPVRNDKNEISHFIAIKQDITQAYEYQRELQLIEKIAWRLRENDEIQKVAQDLLEETLAVIETTTGNVVLLNAEENNSIVSSSRGWFEHIPKPTSAPLAGIAKIVLQSGKTYLIRDLLHDPNINRAVLKFVPPGWAGAMIPIRVGTDTLGVLSVVVPEPRTISSREISMLERAAELAASAIGRRTLRRQVESKYRQLSLLRDIDLAITSSIDLESVLKFFSRECVEQLNVDAAAVVLYQTSSQSLQDTALTGFYNPAPDQHWQLGEGYVGKAALGRQVLYIPDLQNQTQSPSPQIWQDEHFVSYWAIPLWSKGGLQGVLELFTRTKTDFGSGWQDFLRSLAVQAAMAIENSKLYNDLQIANQDLESAYDATIQALSLAIDLRDHETEGHSQRVTKLSEELARHMNLPTEDIVQIRRGALLHDIGKLGVPDNVLLKPGKLDTQEWQLMKQHPVLAHQWLSKIPFLRPALEIPYSHHERMDGSGYPLGLHGNQIPLAARIFAVVDVYDALTSDRPYRKAWTKQKTLDYLRENVDLQFDKTVFEKFEQIINLDLVDS
jgi:PAS domain S-box-containing protein